jgi:cytochrome c5
MRGGRLKKIFGILLFMLLLGVLAACGNEEPAAGDDSAKTEETADTGDKDTSEDSGSAAGGTSLAGNEVFQKSCLTCHSSGDITGGQAKLDGAKIHADFKTKEELLAFVEKNMPQNAPASLSKDEYQAVVDYLWDQQ